MVDSRFGEDSIAGIPTIPQEENSSMFSAADEQLLDGYPNIQIANNNFSMRGRSMSNVMTHSLRSGGKSSHDADSRYSQHLQHTQNNLFSRGDDSQSESSILRNSQNTPQRQNQRRNTRLKKQSQDSQSVKFEPFDYTTSEKYQGRLNFAAKWAAELSEVERDRDQERREIFQEYERMKDIQKKRTRSLWRDQYHAAGRHSVAKGHSHSEMSESLIPPQTLQSANTRRLQTDPEFYKAQKQSTFPLKDDFSREMDDASRVNQTGVKGGQIRGRNTIYEESSSGGESQMQMNTLNNAAVIEKNFDELFENLDAPDNNPFFNIKRLDTGPDAYDSDGNIQRAAAADQYAAQDLIAECLHEKIEIQTSNKARSNLSLYTVQKIDNAHSDSIWVAKFSHCGRYLATGGKDCCLKVWRVKSNFQSSTDAQGEEQKAVHRLIGSSEPDFSLLEKVPAWEFREHAQDIVDLSWQNCRHRQKDEDLILSCSFDNKVILWSLQSEHNAPLQVFDHQDVPSSVSFAPSDADTFVSGCLDGAIRLFSIKKKQMLSAEGTHSNGKVSSLCFSPDGRWLVVGLATVGMCVLYEHYAGNSLNYKSQIDCRNRMGRFSSGRKVAGITFLNNEEFVVATNDSSLRLFSITDCAQSVKFKGHCSEHLQLRPTNDPQQEFVAAGGEDGRVVVWNLANLRAKSPGSFELQAQSLVNAYQKEKERVFEAFMPFQEDRSGRKVANESAAYANVALFAPGEVVKQAQQIYREQVGEEYEREDYGQEIKSIDCSRSQNALNPKQIQRMIETSTQNLDVENAYNVWGGCDIDRRRHVERVLVVCSTDGRLHVYYDEHHKIKEHKFSRV